MIFGHIKFMNNLIEIGKEVIELEIKALKKLKNSINKSFDEAIRVIAKCRSKIIVCGVGKSGIIASKISSTLSSVGVPSFSISANDCSHGDLGKITSQDVLVLISYSGKSDELINIIKFAKQNKVLLICIVSNKNSYLYKNSNIKILIPEVIESGFGIVPTSSTTSQLAIGDALAIGLMKKKKVGKFDFKKFHPAGNLGKKLKTAGDIMLVDKKIPFINENEIMKNALTVLNNKKLGFLIIVNNYQSNVGVFTDGDLKRLIQKRKKIDNLKIKKFMTKKPFAVEKNTLLTDVLAQMNKKKITNICVYEGKNKKKIIGVVHIHNVLKVLK